MIDIVAQYFLTEEYELGRQLCIATNTSFENVAEYMLEQHIPKKWSRYLPISDYKFYKYRSGRKLVGEYWHIQCKMGSFITSLRYHNSKKLLFFNFQYGEYCRDGDWLHNILYYYFSFQVTKVSRSFHKRFLQAYDDAWKLCKKRILESITQNK